MEQTDSVAVDRLSTMKNRFTAELVKLREGSAKNCVCLTEDDYEKLVLEVQDAKNKQKKEPHDYWLLNRYDVMIVENVKKLIYPLRPGDNSVKFYIHDYDLFSILHETHSSIGHGGRDRMLKEINNKYKNVTRHDIELYNSLCELCQKKQKGSKKGLVVKPIISSEFNSRCQVDLIDFQSQPDRDFKFIMVYQDHLTKFVILKPLKTKTAEEVAYNLVDIFTMIGAPSILQSDNGREFSNKIVSSLKGYWPLLKIVHGKPRHSQSQGSVERANQDIENMLSTWMQDEQTNHWSEGLKFVQLMKNRAFHSGIKRTPYEALFGCKVKVGLTTSSLPQEILDTILSEEDLERVTNDLKTSLGDSPHNMDTDAMSSSEKNDTASEAEHVHNKHTTDETNLTTNDEIPSDTQNTCNICSLSVNEKHRCAMCLCDIHISCGNLVQVNKDNNDDSVGNTEETLLRPLCCSKENIANERKRSKEHLEKQAKKMKTLSDQKFPPAANGSTVCVPIPEVDKGKGDLRNVLAVVMEVTEDGFYKLGTKNGILKQLYSRSQFTVCKNNFIRAEDVPELKTGLCSAANAQSCGSGQGFVKCTCKTKCQTKKCACVKNNRQCNSKCHSALPCCNK
ncbi:KRAB-A domain-containing protein 2-like [Nilaparvata lugens]|uniref:KRAB-A domain-containing protein 2-like n=1 Tax=Nilaparvata lugens TaxID=108931 RepID=UPI00193CA0D1|nr:KRAB-A domain-containing protein 2-like [Nilaparvata lugens]